MSGLNNRIAQYVQETLHSMQDQYAVAVEVPEQDAEEDSLIAIHNEHNLCFLIAVTHGDIDDAAAICAQAVLQNSTHNDCTLYYAVFEAPTQIVHFCLCDPHEETYELVFRQSMHSRARQVATFLETYVASNAQALR
ncbi:hypothetical protein HBI51_249160 [Parastagonospora nodorum]|nr:hypothetical protein HBI51_249160 [Parastagonospora nodorum]